MMFEDDRIFDDWDDDWEEENERVYDTWDLVYEDIAREQRTGECHTHVYMALEFPMKMLQYCYMNTATMGNVDAVPSYSEAEVLIDCLRERGYELQYDLADGQLYRFDWNAKDEFTEREKCSLEEAVVNCKDWLDTYLENAKEQGTETEEMNRILELFNNWTCRIQGDKLDCIQMA